MFSLLLMFQVSALNVVYVSYRNLTKDTVSLLFLTQFIYPFQSAPLTKLCIGLLNDIDLISRSTIKEIFELLNDFFSSI